MQHKNVLLKIVEQSKDIFYKYKKQITKGALGSLAVIGCLLLVFMTYQYKEVTSTSLNTPQKLGAFPVTVPTLKYGFALDTFQVTKSVIENNQFLSDILLKHKINYGQIDQIAKKADDIFSVTKLRAGKPYMILAKDTASAAEYFIYEPDDFRYVVYDLRDTMSVKIVEHEITTKIQTAVGTIESSLWNAMVDNGHSFDLTAKLEDVFAWSIDFHHVQKGDQFKLIYDEQFIDGKAVGVGKVRGAYYKNYDNEYHAIYFENEKHHGYFDLEARPMEKAFLKAPVKYSRISSRFNRNRFHPVLKRRKAHLGTDYAAPYGTPIFAVADGVVVKRGYGRGNGNYVKIKHDGVYQTQYLHMQNFAKGVNVGVHVKQGQTIGYVGATGLATGPHVCFRFWKNGRQVNHLRENLPPPDPMPKSDIPRYMVVRDSIKAQLDQISFPKIESTAVSVEQSPEATKEDTPGKTNP